MSHDVPRRRGLALFFSVLLALTFACDGASSPKDAASSPIGATRTVTAVPEDVATIQVRIGSLVIGAEIARTTNERAQGLGGRDSIPHDTGMLFVYEEELRPTFTMSPMRFPLDFIWISSDRHVVDLSENVPYPTDDEPEAARIQPASPVLYVLELNAGLIDEFDVEVGDAVELVLEDASP